MKESLIGTTISRTLQTWARSEKAQVDLITLIDTPTRLSKARRPAGRTAIKFNDTFIATTAGGLTSNDFRAGLEFGPDGNLYVAIFSQDKVMRFDGTNGGYIDDFVAAGLGGLDDPHDIMFARDGDLYVASYGTNSVKRFDGTTGAFIDDIVSSGSGGLLGPRFLATTADRFDAPIVENSNLVFGNVAKKLTVSIVDAEISENGGSTTLNVMRLDSIGDVTVNFTISNGDEISMAASVVIPNGQSTSPPVSIDAVDDDLLDGTQTVTVTAFAAGYVDGSDTLDVTDANKPTITSDGGGDTATVSAAENQTAVTDVQTTDRDGDTEGAGLTYSVTGGADQAWFSIDANTGVLSFHVAPDFEHACDADENSIYEVQVSVADSAGLIDVQNIAVTVTDINDTSLAQIAYDLDQQFKLTSNGNYHDDLIGLDEKWMRGKDDWYFIQNDGRLYRWAGNVNDSELVATLDASYHADPSKLHNAEKPVDALLAQRAYDLDQQHNLSSKGNYHEDLIGLCEKWMRGNDGWYFITTGGSLFRWTGNLATSDLVDTFDATYYDDLSKLHDAPDPNTNGSGNADPILAQAAYDLDQQHNLKFTGNYYLDLIHQDEKWMRGSNAWYFIKPDGSVYRWAGNLADSPWLGTLDASYHADPSKLHSAPNPNTNGNGNVNSSVEQIAYDFDQAHNLRFTGNYYIDRIGLGEKWVRGDDGWYFIKPDGTVYRWTGSIATIRLVGTLDASYHGDPSKLHDAPPP